jgi:tetratricopeptide (TPR) repeat protein
MSTPGTAPALASSPTSLNATHRHYTLIVLLLVACGVAHASWATALDSFTFDEAYHIAAGATYLRFHDFRINPEHPPLVKFVAALATPASVLHLTPLPRLDGKEQEREYTETAVYLNNDPRAIQRRARIAMFAFHSALLIVLALLLRRLFNPEIAIATLGLILLDPTVSAHLPVVMTDLPLALLGVIAVALAILVVRDGRIGDAFFLGISAGAALATKHSAILIVAPIIAGCAGYVVFLAMKARPWTRTALLLISSAAVGSVTLWGMYGFRYNESFTAEQQFNRPLELKISDLQSLQSRAALTFAAQHHLAPRAYIWGLADTLRAGIEGRDQEIHVFGRIYESRPPTWVPLAYVLIKIPIGSLALTLAGLAFLFAKKLPKETMWPLLAYQDMGIFFLGFVCLKGVPYAGVRHLLFVIPILALFGGIALAQTFAGRSRPQLAFAAIALLAAAISVLPQRRPWEYHNFIAGGTANAWKGFNNESVDLAQRSNELITFYNAHKNGEPTHVGYWITSVIAKSAGIPVVSFDFDKPVSSEVSGWFYMRTADLSPTRHFDLAGLRDAVPLARFGNLVIFHGTYHLPGFVASAMYWRAKELTYLNPPDPAKAEVLLRKVMELEPNAYTTAIDLGNFALQRKEVPAALEWYRRALDNAPPQVQGNIAEQISKLASGVSPASIPPLHNPSQE